jgi:hypothetical protein
MSQGFKRSFRIKKNLTYLFYRMQKTALNAFCPWVTSHFLSLSKNGLSQLKPDKKCTIYDKLSFIWYKIANCTASSSPEHHAHAQ